MNPADNVIFDPETNILVIEPFPGIDYVIRGQKVSGEISIERRTVLHARPAGRLIDDGAQRVWVFDPSELSQPESEGVEPLDDESEKIDSTDEVLGLGHYSNL